MSQASPKDGSPTSSNVGDRKPRKQRRPPQRLGWPATLSQGSNPSNSNSISDPRSQRPQHHPEDDDVDGKKSPRKRARGAPPVTLSHNGNSQSNTTAMWVDKFAPMSTVELCVAPKKVKEIKSWMDGAVRLVRNDSNVATMDRAQTQRLLVLVGSPGIGKSTAVRVIAKELHLNVLSWDESFLPRSMGTTNGNSLFSVQQTSALDSFHEFLQQCGSGRSPLQLSSSPHPHSNDQGGSFNQKSIILLEDLPNLFGYEAEGRFRSLMSRHLQRSQTPTILVFSDVSEGKHRPEDLERLIDPDDLYSPDRATIMQIHSVTKPKMKKVLSTVARQVGFVIDTNFLDDLHLQSNGDIRQALMTLQLHATGLSTAEVSIGTKHPRDIVQMTSRNNRDTKLSTFHALGKLLYAKRTINANGSASLAFDPEDILERSDLGLEGSLRFLEYHSGTFFTDITELSIAYDYFSDASELMMGTSGRRDDHHHSTTNFHFTCASSIAGRAVANSNFHPTPNTFRQFSKPKVFDVLRKGRQNQLLVDQLCRRLSSTHLATSNTLGNHGTFITESLPFVRMIVPYEIDPFVDNLYSVARDEYLGRRNIELQTEDIGLKEQEEILGMDDIVEYDTDDDDNDVDADNGKDNSRGKAETNDSIIVIDD